MTETTEAEMVAKIERFGFDKPIEASCGRWSLRTRRHCSYSGTPGVAADGHWNCPLCGAHHGLAKFEDVSEIEESRS